MCEDNDNGFFQFLPARKSPDLLISALRKAALPCLRRRCLLVRFGDHQGTVSRITNYALWVCWDCTGPEVYPVHSGALDQYWSGFVPHHLFMTRRRGGDFCPPKTDLESGLLLSRSASDEICRKIREIFLRQVSRRPSWRGRCQWRRRVRRAGQRAKEQAFASHTWDPFTCEFRLRVCPISSKAAAMSAVRFLKGRWPHLPSRLRARQIPG